MCCDYGICTAARDCPVREERVFPTVPCPERRIVKAAAAWFSAALIAVGCACVILAVQV